MTFRNCQIEIDDNGQIIGGSLDRVFKNGKGKTFSFSFFGHDIIFSIDSLYFVVYKRI